MASLPASIKIGHIGTAYLRTLTDDFSIWQHSKGDQIDTTQGYSLDDAARALLAALVCEEPELAKIYLHFIHRACCNFAEPVNFFDFNRVPVNRPLSPDALGEVYWAVSVAGESGFDKKPIQEIKEKIVGHISPTHDLRPLAYAALSGEPYMIQRFEQEFEKAWKQHANHWWPWPEDTLRYANAILPLAMLFCNPKEKRTYAMLDFLNTTCTHTGVPCPIGNDGWYSKGGKKAVVTQQPIDPAYQVWANALAFSYTGAMRYQKEIKRYTGWFWGWNTVGKSVIDTSLERVFDGIHADGISENCGSECTVCYLITQALYEDVFSAANKSAISTLFRPIHKSAAP